MWLLCLYGVRGFSMGLFTQSLDISQQNQVWPLTSVSDPRREWEVRRVQRFDTLPWWSIRPWGSAGYHLTLSDLEKLLSFLFGFVFHSVLLFHFLTSQLLNIYWILKLFSTIQVWSPFSTLSLSFYPPSWPATYVYPLATFFCSCSNKWSSFLFPLMSAPLSLLKYNEM